VEATHLITIEETQVIELVDLWLCAPPQTISSDPDDDYTNSLSMGLDLSSFNVTASTRHSACATPDKDASAADTVPIATPDDKAQGTGFASGLATFQQTAAEANEGRPSDARSDEVLRSGGSGKTSRGRD
jgi:hypothetical protein